ncbi:MAG: hypothetical protein NTY02_15885 [Acidobacteria bacterium]|nr:hypothetical protein [Acidobacteriota bacterium]
MKLVVSLLIGLVVINVVLAAAVAGAISLNWTAPIVISIVGALAAVVAAFMTQRAALAWAGLIAMPAGILAGMDASSYAELSRQSHVRDVLVADATAHPEAGAFSFRDGTVRMDLSGTSRRVSRSSRDFWAAPVVGDGWTESMPVTVWAVCDQVYGCTREWKQAFRAGIRPTAPVSEYLTKAIANAEADRGLTSAPNAVMIVWVRSVESAIAEENDRMWFGVKLWNGVWIASVLIVAAISAWRRKPRQ